MKITSRRTIFVALAAVTFAIMGCWFLLPRDQEVTTLVVKRAPADRILAVNGHPYGGLAYRSGAFGWAELDARGLLRPLLFESLRPTALWPPDRPLAYAPEDRRFTKPTSLAALLTKTGACCNPFTHLQPHSKFSHSLRLLQRCA